MEELNKILAEKYFRNESTPQETNTVLAWLNTLEGKQYLADKIAKDYEDIETGKYPLAEDIPTQQMLASIRKGREGGTDKVRVLSTEKIQEARSVSWRKMAYRLAAVCTGNLLVAAFYRFFLSDNILTHQTAFGETAVIVLPDSSRVTLNGNSKLTYAADWSAEKPREVQLEGEAFFDVQHTLNHQKFLVRYPTNSR